MLSGASMVRAIAVARKMVDHPIRPPSSADGLQLINWVAEIETASLRKRDWDPSGDRDFHRRLRLLAFSDWLRCARGFIPPPIMCWNPMGANQDPPAALSFGRVTCSATPPTRWCPRGSNGGPASDSCRGVAHLGAARNGEFVASPRAL